MPVSRTATLTPSPVYPACHMTGADLRDARVEGGADLAVQPQTGDRQRRSGHRRAGVRAAGDRLPEGRGVGLGRVERLAPDDGQRAAVVGDPGERVRCGGEGLRPGAAARVADDQRQRAAVRVVVPVLDQLGDVEQPPVEHAVRDHAQGVLRDDVRVAVLAPHREAGPLAARAAQDPGDPAVGADDDAVTGDERHRRGGRRLSPRRARRPRLRRSPRGALCGVLSGRARGQGRLGSGRHRSRDECSGHRRGERRRSGPWYESHRCSPVFVRVPTRTGVRRVPGYHAPGMTLVLPAREQKWRASYQAIGAPWRRVDRRSG